MIKTVFFLFCSLLFATTAAAQDIWDDYSPWEHSVEGEVVLAIAANDQDKGGEAFLGAVSVTGKSTYIFESGLIIGVVGELGLQKDHPARVGFSGSGPSNLGGTISTSPFSGVSSIEQPEELGPRGALEKAYLTLEGGYGELRLGRDAGVAKEFHVAPEPVLSAVTVANARLDPLGSLYARTDHDVTGPSGKLSYISPRLLGVQAGASYTPDANVRGLDRDPVRNMGGAPAVSIEDAWEIALNGSRRLRKSGLRLSGSAAWSTADVSDRNLANSGNMRTVSAGVAVSGEKWKAGIDHLVSNNGVKSGSSDYQATTIGFTRDWNKFRAGIFHAHIEDDHLNFESDATSIELGYIASEAVSLAISYQDTGVKMLNPTHFQGISPDKRGVVIEITRYF